MQKSACITVDVGTEILNGNYTGIDTITTMDEKCSWSTIDTLKNLRITLMWETVTLRSKLWNVILMFVLCLTPYSVNWYLHWLLISQTAGETTESHLLQLRFLSIFADSIILTRITTTLLTIFSFWICFRMILCFMLTALIWSIRILDLD